MPFADATSDGLPLGQLLRLSLFQASVGMAQGLMRGGLAVLPFALIGLAGDQIRGPEWAGTALAAVAFLMTGIGMHMTRTAGLALASDRATDETRLRVMALLYVMYLAGMGISALVAGWLLRDFAPLTLVRVVQGCGLATLVLNLIALWKQEKVSPMTKAERAAPAPTFSAAWADLMKDRSVMRLLVVVVLGTLSFNMQDVRLEPYGGQILGLSVGQTTLLTAMWSLGALCGFLLAARGLGRGQDPFRLAAKGALAGIAAFSAVIVSGAPQRAPLFHFGAIAIGFGSGIFGVSTLTAAMAMPGSRCRRLPTSSCLPGVTRAGCRCRPVIWRWWAASARGCACPMRCCGRICAPAMTASRNRRCAAVPMPPPWRAFWPKRRRPR